MTDAAPAPNGAHNQQPEYLTTKELAELLRIKERKVYDLAASGEVPCTKATGKLLFPRREIEAWLAASRSGRSAAGAAAGPRPAVFLGSHDPVLDWALREARTGIATYFDGSADGLTRLAAGEGVAAGLHLYDADADDWNAPAVERHCGDLPFVLVAWARRRRGLVFADDAERRPSSLADVKGLRVAARQPEAGAQVLFEHLAARAGLAEGDYQSPIVARTETDAALAVSRGQADVCFGLEAVAREYRLGFAPIVEEPYDLLIDRRAWFEPPMQAFLSLWRSDAFRRQADAAIGYDFSRLGEVRWNGP